MLNQEIPTKRGHWLFGNTLALQRDPLKFYSEIAQLGRVVRYPFGKWRDIFLITHPDEIKHVLVNNQKNYSVMLRYRKMFKLAMGEGLFTSEGPDWLRKRRMMQPAFRQKEIAKLADIMVSTVEKRIENWQPDQPIDISHSMTQLTLETIAACLFGVNITEHVNKIGVTITEMMALFAQWVRSPAILFPVGLISHTRRKLLASIGALDDLVTEIIQSHHLTNQTGDNLLSTLLSLHDEESGLSMSKQQIRDEVRTMLFNGHETTASTLAWAFYLISQHPNVKEKLLKEIDDVLGGRRPTIQDMQKLPFTQMVIKETLRLYPPLWLMFRQAKHEDVIGGYPIPAGSRVTICLYMTHRHPEFWPEPERFYPERFEKEPKPFTYLPFGAGMRQCIGKHFAMLETQITLATILQRYKLRPITTDYEPEALLTIRPKKPIVMTVEERHFLNYASS